MRNCEIRLSFAPSYGRFLSGSCAGIVTQGLSGRPWSQRAWLQTRAWPLAAASAEQVNFLCWLLTYLLNEDNDSAFLMGLLED